MIHIRDLRIGQSAVVRAYAPGSEAYKARLLSMGLTRGTVIRLTKLAPLGDPVEIELRGYKLSLRKDEAAVLELEDAQ